MSDLSGNLHVGDPIPSWVDTVDYSHKPPRMSGNLRPGKVFVAEPTSLSREQLLREDGEVLERDDGTLLRMVEVIDEDRAASAVDVEKARAEYVDRLKRLQDVLLWREMERQLWREYLENMADQAEPALIEFFAAESAEDRPKPQTSRDRVRAMKAHPRSVRGRA